MILRNNVIWQEALGCDWQAHLEASHISSSSRIFLAHHTQLKCHNFHSQECGLCHNWSFSSFHRIYIHGITAQDSKESCKLLHTHTHTWLSDQSQVTQVLVKSNYLAYDHDWSSSCRTNWNTLTLKPTLHKLIHLHKINSFMQKQTLQVNAEISMKAVVVPEGVPKHFVPVGLPWMPQNPHRKGSQNTCQMHGIHQSKEPQY